MTSEYDELLAELDDKAFYGDRSSAETAAAIRALTAQVVERDAVIEQAPHAEDCDVVLYPEMNLYPGGDSMCDCWKGEATHSPLAAALTADRKRVWEEGRLAGGRHYDAIVAASHASEPLPERPVNPYE